MPQRKSDPDSSRKNGHERLRNTRQNRVDKPAGRWPEIK